MFQYTNVKKMALIPPSLNTTYQSSKPRATSSPIPIWSVGEGCQVDVCSSEELQQFVFRMDTHQGRYESPSSGPGNDSGKQATQMQCFHDAQMAQPENLSTLKHQDRPSKRLPRIMENIQLCLVCQSCIRVPRRGVLCKVLDCVGNLRDVIFDQELRSSVGAIVEFRCGYVSEVAHETAAKEVYEAENVIVFLGFVDRGETLVDQAVIIVFAYGCLAPVNTIISRSSREGCFI